MQSWIDRYLHERVALGDFTPDTAKNYRSVLYGMAAAMTNPRDMLERHDIADYLTGIENAAPTTQRFRIVVIRCFFSWCIEAGLIRANPAAGIKPAKLPPKEPRFLEAEQVGPLLITTTSTRDRLIVELGVQVGLRRREVWALDIEDVDLAARTIAVRGKGHRGEVDRYVPLNDEILSAMRAYLAESPTFTGPLIRNYRGGRLSRSGISEVVSAAMTRSGAKTAARDGKSMHALRHTCFQHLMDGGADVREVQALAGHASVTTTEIYLRRKMAADRLMRLTEGRTYETG